MILRVLIVDDEYLLCEHIRQSIDWKTLKMEVVGTARNGSDALRLIEEKHPDIVLADINMPIMNGLQLAQKVQESHPHVRMILVTGYGEFEYAQQAIRFGVKRYLLKPINADLYFRELQAVRDEILHSDAIKNEPDVFKEQVYSFSHSFPAFREILEPTFENSISELAYSILSGKMGPWCLAILQCDSDSHVNTDASMNQALMEISMDLDAHILNTIPHALFSHDADSFIALIVATEYAVLLDKLTCWCNSIRKKQHLAPYIGISNRCTDRERVQEMYLQAQRALAATYIKSNKYVITFSEVGDESIETISEYFDPERLLIALRLNNQEDIHSIIKELFARMNNFIVSKDKAVFISLLLIDVLQRFLHELNVSISGMSFGDVNIYMRKKKTLQELQDYVTMLFEKALESVFYQPKNENSSRAQKICQYIRNNYANKDLSLNTVAKAMYLNASYLSTLFRKETGITLIEYINKVRLKTAKELIDNSEATTVCELANRVGYNNEYYFMRCFKKQYGISPKTYMNLKQQENKT